MSDRHVPPHVPPRDYEGKKDRESSLEQLKKQGYIPNFLRKNRND